jgi:hypothetical protein
MDVQVSGIDNSQKDQQRSNSGLGNAQFSSSGDCHLRNGQGCDSRKLKHAADKTIHPPALLHLRDP